MTRDEARLKQEREAKTKALAQAQWEADLRRIMATREGRHVVWSILLQAGTFAASYTPGTGATDAAYREGRRSVGLELKAKLEELCPEDYLHTLTETLAERTDEQLRRKVAASKARDDGNRSGSSNG
jgi:hypothetical protein